VVGVVGIGDRRALSSDKSKLKLVLRLPALAADIECVADDAAYLHAPAVRYVFEDGAIIFSSLSSSMTGADVYRRFARLADAAFRDNVHTYVLCFDDKRHVPTRKAATQAKRRAALEAANERAWHWDGTSTIVGATSHERLPPWSDVRLDARAARAAVGDICRAMTRLYRPPPGRRLIVDSEAGRFVVETSIDGADVLEPYADTSDKPATLGEADIVAQYYVERSTRDETRDDEQTTFSRAHVRLDERALSFYDARSSDVPPSDRRLPGDVSAHEIPASRRRRCFEAGAIVLRTTDTDFVPLSLVAQLRHETAAVHVSLGTVHRDATGAYVTSTTESARAATELYDIRRLTTCIEQLHRPSSRETAIWSFVAFCAACGNDYTRRPEGFSPLSLFAAYRSSIARGNRLVARVRRRVPVLDARALTHLLRTAYNERLPEGRRPVSWTDDVPSWLEINARIAMPSHDDTLAYYEQVAWSLTYAAVAVDGITI